MSRKSAYAETMRTLVTKAERGAVYETSDRMANVWQISRNLDAWADQLGRCTGQLAPPSHSQALSPLETLSKLARSIWPSPTSNVLRN